MLYIDFDGVILDTATLLFEEWRKNPERDKLPEREKIRYIQNSDWNYIIYHSKIINNSIECLKEMNPKQSFILTKINSVENEGYAKIKWLRENGIKQGIILVPYHLKKTDLVDAKGNVLVDDCLKNLEEWEEEGGKPIFFDMDNDNIDSWERPNDKGYQKILTLSSIQ